MDIGIFNKTFLVVYVFEGVVSTALDGAFYADEISCDSHSGQCG